MRRALVASVAVGLLLAAAVPLSAEEGQLKDKIIAALEAVAGGSCPEELMSPLLLDICEQQLDQMQSRLSSLGAIKSARFRGMEQLPNGMEAEVYRVTFAKGQMLWMANAAPNGKLNGLWSPG